MDFTNLITSNIDEKFCYIRYDEFKLIMLKGNGFINATKLCKLGGKDFNKWKRLEGSKELIKNIEDDVIKSVASKSSIILEINESKVKNKTDITGTYVHRYLIPYITSWISPHFAIKLSKIVTYYITGQYDDKLKSKEIELQKIYKALTDFSLKYDSDALELKEHNKLMEQKYEYDITDMKLRIAYLKEQNNEIKQELRKIGKKIACISGSYHYVKFRHLMILQKKTDPTSFKVLLIRRECLEGELNKLKDDYRVFFSVYEPNAVPCFNRLKEKLLELKHVQFYYNDFTLINTDIYDANNLIEDLHDMDLIRRYA
ncbi:SWPV1-132 [Shearwaterpox virus]|uniref:SWPV1-132 n=1 Tax=Shearwaterpox virus TaxID=1974596 RepID=A0A1V0S7X5_CNPV|nr:SWPV1-132 [Shearwaterpox virus]